MSEAVCLETEVVTDCEGSGIGEDLLLQGGFGNQNKDLRIYAKLGPEPLSHLPQREE